MINLTIRIDAHDRGNTIESIRDAERLSAFSAQSPALDARHPGSPSRPIKIAADGSRLPPDYTGTDHVAVLFPDTSLMVAVSSITAPDDPDSGLPHAECIEACRKLDLLGFNDWQLASRAEAASLIDDTRHEPAIDTNLFPGIKSAWHWTRTPAAWSAASAWYLYFSYGYVYSNSLRDYGGFGLAVRRAGQ